MKPKLVYINFDFPWQCLESFKNLFLNSEMFVKVCIPNIWKTDHWKVFWRYASQKSVLARIERTNRPYAKMTIPLNFSFVHIQNSLSNFVRDNKFITIFVSKIFCIGSMPAKRKWGFSLVRNLRGHRGFKIPSWAWWVQRCPFTLQ